MLYGTATKGTLDRLVCVAQTEMIKTTDRASVVYGGSTHTTESAKREQVGIYSCFSDL